MIKKPKIGQSAFFAQKKGVISVGKITALHGPSTIVIDNKIYWSKNLAFKTSKEADQHQFLGSEFERLQKQVDGLVSQQKKICAALEKMIND